MQLKKKKKENETTLIHSLLPPTVKNEFRLKRSNFQNSGQQ